MGAGELELEKVVEEDDGDVELDIVEAGTTCWLEGVVAAGGECGNVVEGWDMSIGELLSALPHPGIARYCAAICPATGLLGTLAQAALPCGAAWTRAIQHATAKGESNISTVARSTRRDTDGLLM